MAITHPNELHQAFADATNRKDLDAALELYAADGLAIHLDGSQALGQDSLEVMLLDLFGAMESMEGTTRKIYVNGDVALTSASWKGLVKLPDGSVEERSGTTVEVSTRQPDGTWKMVIDDPLF
jgi:uncharacterized protein (TIGR02246 family)